MSGQQKHHCVPRVLLRRFAKDGRLIRIQRSGPYPRGRAFFSTECTIDDFNRRESPLDADPNRFERFLATEIEAPARAAFDAVVGGDFPPSERTRRALARFTATQFVRGPDLREILDTVIDFVGRPISAVLGPTRAARVLGELGLPLRSGAIGLAKDAMIGIQERLSRHLAVGVERSRLALLRFRELSLVTSDRPVVQWGKIERVAPPFGVGIAVAHSLSLHLDPRHALLFIPEHVHADSWTEQVVDANADHANVLNHRTAAWANERVFHHPDHDPLAGMPLPPRQSPGEILAAEIRARLASKWWPLRHLGERLFGLHR